ncbi:MAG: DUF1131 family protein [Stappiaceae bacterium]
MKLTRIAFAMVSCCALTACIAGSDGPDGAIGAISTSQTTLLTITKQGAGTITADTDYGSKSIESQLPGFTTQPVQIAVESKTLWTLAAFQDGFQVIQVLKGSNGKVGEIHGVTHHLAGPNGERIGMTFSQIGSSKSRCRVGKDLWRGMAVCPSKNAANVKLVYAIPGYQGPFDRLPTSEDLRGASLQRIVWNPAV